MWAIAVQMNMAIRAENTCEKNFHKRNGEAAGSSLEEKLARLA